MLRIRWQYAALLIALAIWHGACWQEDEELEWVDDASIDEENMPWIEDEDEDEDVQADRSRRPLYFDPGNIKEHMLPAHNVSILRMLVDTDEAAIRGKKWAARLSHALRLAVTMLEDSAYDYWSEKMHYVANMKEHGERTREMESLCWDLCESDDLVEPGAKRLRAVVAERYHHSMWVWHNVMHASLEPHLSETEMRYVMKCFQFAGDEHFNLERKGNRLSYYTYSHRVKPNKPINSSRFGLGLVENPEKVAGIAAEVLTERGITLPQDTVTADETGRTYAFGGLGWDLQEGHFKVYYRVMDLSKLPPRLQPDGDKTKRRSSTGIVSWTFYSNGTLHEEKVYSLERDVITHSNEEVKVNVTRLYGSKRDVENQYDVPAPEMVENQKYPSKPATMWRHRIDERGRRIWDMYMEYFEETLDTITFKNKHDYTLYFP